ncbi:Odorant receptor 374 [Nylanderia fulva]|uniref:Odorant receptor n=1 Tax=Nylanderia fulva TaxID=613905 RepID=A0A6G1LP15_9HYME|nr:Odorant receptor 374 [Nylanderia fulva]
MLLNIRDTQLDFEWAVELNRYSLQFIGLWPKMEETTREKIIANVRVFLLIIMLAFVCAIPCIHSLIRVWGDLMSMTDNLQFTLPLVSMIMKLIIVWNKKLVDTFRNFSPLAPIVQMIAKDWLRLKSDEEREIMIKCARIPRIIIMCGFASMFASFILLIILPSLGITIRYITNVSDPGKPLPLQTYYPYDTDTSPYFELTFLAQGVTLMVSAMGYTAIDSLFGLLIFHVCGQLQNLKNRLTDKKDSNFDRILADVISDHIITDKNRHLSVVRLLFLITVLANIFGHMCLYCAVGEFLITQCENIYSAACEYCWYKLKPKQARNLILLMMRSNKPLYVTVGKIFPLTMNAFCSLLKTSGGYISVLLARRD